jgi:hypothetical protein
VDAQIAKWQRNLERAQAEEAAHAAREAERAEGAVVAPEGAPAD